jgi:small subunit ribosomal protein S18
MADKNVRYLNPISIDTQTEKYCRFKKKGIKYIDYKDADFLLMLCNEQGSEKSAPLGIDALRS